MNVYKLQGKAKCVFCGEDAGLYVDEVDITVCRKCGVTLYKKLGEHFVPSAVPNVILRSESQHRPLWHFDGKTTEKAISQTPIVNKTEREYQCRLKHTKRRHKRRYKRHFSTNKFEQFTKHFQQFFKKLKSIRRIK